MKYHPQTYISLRPNLGLLQIGIRAKDIHTQIGALVDIVMSDSEDSTITYTEVSSPYEDLSDRGSPGVMVYGYGGLPMHPPSLDYVSSPEEPE
ncbi:hypothetical protein Tco_0668926 [Tanacetum coccineum]